MPNLSAVGTAANVHVDRSSGVPLHRQLYDSLREAILANRLKSGTRLPATRQLALDLGVSRGSVVGAYEQLLAEGYVEGLVGSGTYVARTLPEDLIVVREGAGSSKIGSRGGRSLSRRGKLLASTPVAPARDLSELPPFRMGVPAVDLFPLGLWADLLARHWRRSPRDLLSYGDPAGYLPLREAIASYLGAARAVRCEAHQVIIVAGAQHGLSLAAQLLLDEREAAWIEDPGYLGARGALLGAGARLVPVPVDGEGLNVAAGVAACPEARIAYTSPSHQAPLGATMSLARRLALLEWAHSFGAWIVEDDYDSEFRYSGRPLAALQGLDTLGRVIYLGTFSKVLLPGLRLGYLVVPPDLVEAFVAARALMDRQPPAVEQAALAEFITDGHFARHLRRMRTLYAERQAVLVEAAQRELRGLLEVRPSAAGMHLVGWLPEGMEDTVASFRAAKCGIEALPLSRFVLQHRQPAGLLLGYAAFEEEKIHDGVRRLTRALEGL